MGEDQRMGDGAQADKYVFIDRPVVIEVGYVLTPGGTFQVKREDKECYFIDLNESKRGGKELIIGIPRMACRESVKAIVQRIEVANAP